MKFNSIARLGGTMACAGVLWVSVASAATEQVIHSFAGKGVYDGDFPLAPLINVNGTLYGTTNQGGLNSCSFWGCGTVFSINPTTGAEAVVYAFKGGSDGYYPHAGLIDVNDIFYGTTWGGGSGGGGGTVYSVTPGGTERVIYSFGSTAGDGVFPNAGLIDVNGTLYGTTEMGGGAPCGLCGTVFSIDPKTGVEAVLYAFKGGSDGEKPMGELINIKGTLYGTTVEGGTGICSSGGPNVGCGTIFSVTTNGIENVLYSFKGGSDGAAPAAGLIKVKGILYGTTEEGGSQNCVYESEGGCGTVFSVTPSGTETVLHAFRAGNPVGSLIEFKGMLYGTTTKGGRECAGTVFKISPSGKENLLYCFGSSGIDGGDPYAGLINANGTLYGTTEEGGAGNCTSGDFNPGCGTVFSIKP
jgi:uncharacterized repeat protein (TIGR03803 family)